MEKHKVYARRVSMKLKPESLSAFTKSLETEIIPILRKQKGFKDEIALVSPDGREVLAISLWDRAESAKAYNTGAYSQVTKILSSVVEETARVSNFDVANSTFHKVGAPTVV